MRSRLLYCLSERPRGQSGVCCGGRVIKAQGSALLERNICQSELFSGGKHTFNPLSRDPACQRGLYPKLSRPLQLWECWIPCLWNFLYLLMKARTRNGLYCGPVEGEWDLASENSPHLFVEWLWYQLIAHRDWCQGSTSSGSTKNSFRKWSKETSESSPVLELRMLMA